MATDEVVAFIPIEHDRIAIAGFEITKLAHGSQHQVHTIDEQGARHDLDTYDNLPEALAGVACKMAAQPGVTYKVEK